MISSQSGPWRTELMTGRLILTRGFLTKRPSVSATASARAGPLEPRHSWRDSRRNSADGYVHGSEVLSRRTPEADPSQLELGMVSSELFELPILRPPSVCEPARVEPVACAWVGATGP